MYRLLGIVLLLWVTQQRNTVDNVPRHSTPQNLPCSDQPRSMNELVEAYDKGRIPSPLEMNGSWVASGFVGDSETPSFNCNGVTRGPKFEWVMHANQYSVSMEIIGVGVQKRTLKPDNDGSLAIPVAFGGDSTPVYKCRLTLRKTLACVFHGPGGTTGVEFKKIPVQQ